MIKTEGKLVYKPKGALEQTIALYVHDIQVIGKDIEVSAVDVTKLLTFYYSSDRGIWLVPDPDSEDADCFKEFEGTVVSFEYRYYWTKE
jgi:hypothetical protein